MEMRSWVVPLVVAAAVLATPAHASPLFSHVSLLTTAAARTRMSPSPSPLPKAVEPAPPTARSANASLELDPIQLEAFRSDIIGAWERLLIEKGRIYFTVPIVLFGGSAALFVAAIVWSPFALVVAIPLLLAGGGFTAYFLYQRNALDEHIHALDAQLESLPPRRLSITPGAVTWRF